MTTDTDSQNRILLDHFRSGGTVTHSEALECFGISNLSGRIAELRQAGYRIGDAWEHGENRYGKTVRWKRYALRPEVEERRGVSSVLSMLDAR